MSRLCVALVILAVTIAVLAIGIEPGEVEKGIRAYYGQ